MLFAEIENTTSNEIGINSAGNAQFTNGAISDTDRVAFRPANFEIRHTDDKGNAMFATRNIVAGEFIFSECPQFWNVRRSTSEILNAFCRHCGAIVQPGCGVNCQQCVSIFCSAKCSLESIARGHEFFCDSLCNSELVSMLCDTDPMGNYGLALFMYCFLAKQCCLSIANASSRSDSSTLSMIDEAFINEHSSHEAEKLLSHLQQEGLYPYH